MRKEDRPDPLITLADRENLDTSGWETNPNIVVDDHWTDFWAKQGVEFVIPVRQKRGFNLPNLKAGWHIAQAQTRLGNETTLWVGLKESEWLIFAVGPHK